MTFSDDELEEFRTLWKKHYGTEISKEVALEKGIRLVRLMKVVAQHQAKGDEDTNSPTPIT